MHAQGLPITIFIISISDLAYGFDKVSFVELSGKRLSSNIIETLIVTNKIRCVRACKTNSRCKFVNFKAAGNGIECELNSESTNRTVELVEDDRSTFVCK